MTTQPALGFTVCHAPGRSNVLIKDIESDGPADKAGLRIGDEIISMDGVAIPDMGSFKSKTKGLTVGQHLTIHVLRYIAHADDPIEIACDMIVGRRKSVEDLPTSPSAHKLDKDDVEQAFGKYFAKEPSCTGLLPSIMIQAPELKPPAAAQPVTQKKSLRKKFSSLFH